jgi:hypothetical protein
MTHRLLHPPLPTTQVAIDPPKTAPPGAGLTAQTSVHMSPGTQTSTGAKNLREPTTDTSATPAVPSSKRLYRWRAGDCLANYGQSAKLWKAHSATDDFATAFTAIIDDTTLTNDDRAAKVEDFLLTQATLAGVVDVSYPHRQFSNPNKWDK